MSQTRRRTRATAPPTDSGRPAAVDRQLTVAAISGGITLAIYLATAARDIVVGDPTEFAIVSLSGGVAHPPGYPLLTMVGRLFALLPLDPAPFRVSLVSVASGALAAALVAVTSLRIGASAGAAVLGSLVFATSLVVWRWSVVPEAFALNDALVAGIVLAIVVWTSRPRSAAPLVVAGALAGLAVANHQTAVLIAPAVALLVWPHRRQLIARPLIPAGAAGAFVAGAGAYLYVPLASAAAPQWNWGAVSSAADLWSLVTRQTYGTTQLVSDPALRGGAAVSRVVLLLASYWPLEWLLVAAGAVAAFAVARPYLVATAAATLVAGVAFVAYADIDPERSVSAVVLERFFLLPHTLTAPLIGTGIAAATRLVPRSLRLAPIAVAAAAAAMVALAALPIADRREDRVARTYAADILASVDDGMVVLSAGDDVTTGISYLQIVERQRPGVVHVMQPLLRTEWYVRQLRARIPALRIPFDRLGGAATLRQLVEANPDTRFVVAGVLIDDSLRPSHWLRPRGLVSEIAPLPATGSVDELAELTERLLARYRPPTADEVRGRKWEAEIRGDYARPAFLVGQQYELAKETAKARAWYGRALAIDPTHTRAREALARLPGP